MPFPQLGLVHAPPLQIWPLPQEVPASSGAPRSHFWPVAPFGPFTGVQVAAPLQGSVLLQLSGFVVHENMQVGSQPEPGRFWPDPKSHCSLPKMTPSPQ